MTGSQLIKTSSAFEDRKGIQKAAGAVFEVSEEAVRRLNSSASLTGSCSGCPNDHPSESTSTTTAATSTDSVTNSMITVSKETKKQLQKQERDAALTYVLQQQLERQIASYFSPSNLETDTYLRTLQGLNDGCVPVRALANFGKVKRILWATPSLTKQYLEEEARMEIIVRSIRQSETSILQIKDIDTATGKILEEGDDRLTRNSIVGIRVKSNVDFSTGTFAGTSNVSGSLSETFTNIILLRDVHPDVFEDQVRDLLLNDVVNCPPVVSVHRDVANCWFIELDCDSKEAMLGVVMQLRSLTLAGEYIYARLKSSTLHQAPSLDPVAVIIAEQVARRRRKKRGTRRNKKKTLEHGEEGRMWEKEKPASSTSDPPPLLEESEFPGLCEGTLGLLSQNKNVFPVLEQNNPLLAFPSNNVVGGYVAALLKPKLSSPGENTSQKAAPVEENLGAKLIDECKSTRKQTQRKTFAEAARAFSVAS